MPYFKSDDVTLHYTEFKHQQSTASLIFLHGLGNDVSQGEAIFKENEKINLYCLDQRGHGLSEMGNYQKLGFDTMSDDVYNFANMLGLEKFYIAGVSMGSAVSLAFSMKHPEMLLGMLLLRPAWIGKEMDTTTGNFFKFLYNSLNTDLRGEEAFNAAKETTTYKNLSDELKDNFEKMKGLFFGETHYASKEKFIVIPVDTPTQTLEELKAIKVPTCTLSNRQDNIHPFEYGKFYEENMQNCIWREMACKATDEAQYNKDITAALDYLMKQS